MNSEFEKLRVEIDSISQRLSRIESKLSIGSPSQSIAPPIAQRPKEERISPSAKPSRSISSSTVLAFIAIFFFVMAGGFVIKLAIDSGWLTPERQLGLAALLGLLMVGGGLVLRKFELAYSSLLAGGGIVVLFMAAYGGSLHFALYEGWVAALAAAVVAGISLFLFTEFRSPFYMIAAVVGTYLSALAFPNFQVFHFESATYFLTWALAFSALGCLLKERLLLILSSYLGLLIFALSNNPSSLLAEAGGLSNIAAFQLFHFLIFVAGLLTFSLWHKIPLSRLEAVALTPLLLVFYFFEYSCLQMIIPEQVPWLAIAFGIGINFLFYLGKSKLKEKDLSSEFTVSALSAVVLAHAVYGQLIPFAYQGWFSLGLAALIISNRSRLKLSGYGIPYAILGGGLFVATYLQLLSSFFIGTNLSSSNQIALSFSYGIALIAPFVLFRSDQRIGTFWTLLILFGVAQIFGAIYELVRLNDLGAFSPFAVTSLWALVSLGILIYGLRKNEDAMLKAATACLFVCAAKGLLVDVSTAGPIVRIICLVFLGVALFAGGFMMKKIRRS